MTGRLYTLRAIARDLGLPESTVRYYRDTFPGFVPTTGRGRRRRYPPEAIETFRLISEGFADNRSRDEIRTLLGDGFEQPDGPVPPPIVSPPPMHGFRDDSSRELLSIVLDGERERREVMWQMAREIVRLGEAIERQHVVLGEMAERIERRADRTLPPPAVSTPPKTADGTGLRDEVATLQQELQRERELVDRLRRSKLEIERRAAEAEAELEETGGPAPSGIFRRGRRRPRDA